MAIKTVNNTIRPHSLILTMLVFRAFLRLAELDPPNLLVKQRTAIIKKAIKEVRQVHTKRQVIDALRDRNGPSTIYIHDLKLQDDVLV